MKERKQNRRKEKWAPFDKLNNNYYIAYIHIRVRVYYAFPD